MTIPQAFQIALQHHRAGQLAEAEALYRQILAAQSQHVDALHHLGIVALQSGRHDLAADLIRKAILLGPNNPFAHSNLGEVFRAMGQFDEAMASYCRAVELKPDYPEAHYNLGIVLRARDLIDQAIAHYRRAIELKPDYPQAHNNLGNALCEQGHLGEAIAEYRRALELNPSYSEAYNNLGNALRERGQPDDSVVACRRALELRPDFPEAHNNLGNALRDLRQPDEAFAAYRRALELRPDFPEAHINRGNALQDRGQLDEAIAAFRRALELQPNSAKAHNNLGNALMYQGELDEAVAAHRIALQCEPGNARAHSNLVYMLHLHPGQGATTISEEHQRWNRQFSDPLKAFLQPHTNDCSPDRRLRVGYVSPDFLDHSVGRYALPLFECVDREKFEIWCYSGVLGPDSMTERFRALVSGWRNTIGISDTRLAEMIREDKIDILVDLTMHAASNRLPVFARQPAPVQATWLAYPGSTGLHGIGYRLTDAHMDPPGERPAWSAEEPVRLPDCWCCFQPGGNYPEITALPALSGKGVTFGALNSFTKVNEAVLRLWARVLKAAKGSRLLMSCPEGSARKRVRAFFGAHGIGEERVEFVSYLPRWDYFRLYQRIDVALDPFPFNGMTTTCDALWMGAPVLTLPGEMPASRASLSLLSNIGLAELAASSEEDYVRTAVELAGDLPRIAELRARLRPTMLASPLMDAPRFARNVEAAYRSMWRRWCAAGG